MSDTVILGKTIKGSTQAILIYLAMDICTTVLSAGGQALMELDPTEWAQWWTPKRIGWVMIQAGSILTSAFILYKGMTSNSTKS